MYRVNVKDINLQLFVLSSIELKNHACFFVFQEKARYLGPNEREEAETQ